MRPLTISGLWMLLTLTIPGMPSFAIEAPRGVIVFIADDQGEGDAGCYGNTSIRTPNLDALAKAGMRFENAFLTTSSCSPSRSSILTGRWPHNTNAEDLHTPLPAEQKTVAQYLQTAGWYCAAIGKWHLGNNEKQHWDTIVPCGGEQIGAKAVQAFKNRPQDKRFFFWIASTDPHRGYRPNAIPQPHDPQQVRVPAFLPDHPQVRTDIALYYDEINRFDKAVGDVLAAVDDDGLSEDTLVIYMSDNGMPFARAKTTLYDSGIRTPFLVRWPKQVAPQSVQPHLLSSIDIAPTILELAGVPQTTMQGTSMLPLLAGKGAPIHDAIYAEANWHDYEQFTRAVRTRRYKLVHNYYHDQPLWHPADSVNSITWKAMLELHAKNALPPHQAYLMQAPRPQEELFDLEADPHEFTNLAQDPNYQEVLTRMRGKLDAWREMTDDRLPEKRRDDGFTRDGKRIQSVNPKNKNKAKPKAKPQRR